MEDLHQALTAHFLQALQGSEVSPALLKEIRMFLADNDIQASPETAKQMAQDFLDQLPTYDPES